MRIDARRWLVTAAAALVSAAPATAASPTTATFEGGAPAGFYVFNGSASSVATTTPVVGEGQPLARPGQVGDNTVLTAQFTVADFGGFGVDFAAPGSTGPQDWIGTDGFAFWFHGSNSGLVYQAEILDNRSNPSADTAERFDYDFTDNFTGWRLIRISFSAFERATDFQPPGAPNDGLTLTEMWGWAIILPPSAMPRTFSLDDVGPIEHVIDDFEAGLPAGTDPGGPSIGFFTFQGAASTAAIATAATPPAPVLPAVGEPNTVLQLDLDVTSFAGVIHNFHDLAVTVWVSQNWSRYEGFALWVQGTGSGTDLFIDVIENRNPGSTRDDAERWTAGFEDNFVGWRQMRFPFSSLTRKEIGNGAPNDGLALTEVHGWALGAVGTGGPRRYFVDQVTLFGAAEEPPLTVAFSSGSYGVGEGGSANATVRLSRPLGDDDPQEVTVGYALVPGTATPDRDYTPASGTLTFTRGGATEQAFTVATLPDTKHEGGETVLPRLSGPVGAELGFFAQAIFNINDDDPFDPNLLDDFETEPVQLAQTGDLALEGVEVRPGDPLAVPGQGPFEGLLHVETPILVDVDVSFPPPRGCRRGQGVVAVAILTRPDFDATTVDHSAVRFGDAREVHRQPRGRPARHVADADADGDADLVLHFELADTGFGCHAARTPLRGRTFAGQRIVHDGQARFGRDFALGQDWTAAEGLSFWFYGTNSGSTYQVEVKDNRAPDPGPSAWPLLWSDEFDGPAGQRPDARVFSYEIGDGSANNIPGWGNSELQYYTDDPANAAADGAGHLVITARRNDSLPCYYGVCRFTSARLKTQGKREVGYGRVEARIRLPRGAGLWPAFWSMGTDIGQVGWPRAGEIDIMEWVGREPEQVFGTIHGPGYSGGDSFGGIHDFGSDVSETTHTFAVEREPGLIRWYVDDILYHQATPADVAPDPWVFDHPFFLLLNLAVGGNFGGPVSPDVVFPQSMAVDYIRVFGALDTAERFEAPFLDDFAGWRKVTVPFTAFRRSPDQPPGAPDDGFGRNQVWGYGFVLPEGGTRGGQMWLARVELAVNSSATVTTTDDSGAGSLRQALAALPVGGTVTFDPALAGQTITLTSGSLVLSKNVTIDAIAAPGLTISGNGTHRVFIVDAGVTASLSRLTIADGLGLDLAGGILNNGSLALHHCTVRDNGVGAATNEFWKGGGGIYNGNGSSLLLRDSIVRGNTTQLVDGGGVYAFFNTQVTIERSTISGNLAGNVGGGIRSLGNVTLTNSTVSGNTSTAWHGGAVFHTDGVMGLVNTTVTANLNPPGTAAVFVGTFTAANASLNVANSVVGDNQNAECVVVVQGSGTVSLTSGGHNVFTDATCAPTGTDQQVPSALLAPLGDNGGPTPTHALLDGSPAIDAADGALCPATDQRGVARPQGPACDAGAFERAP
jgi:beta-glucanase (GH16 family)